MVSNTNTSRFGEGDGVGVQTGSYNEISGNHIELNRSRGVEIWGGDFKNNEGRTYGNGDGNKIWGNEFVNQTDIYLQLEDSAVQQDPQFVNFAQADFHLRENSPLRDVGAAHEIIQDYDLVSVPVGSGYDIGAFEFSSSLSPSMTPSQSSCVADISGDNRVDLLDYSILVNNFLLTTPIDTRADINTDGAVDLKDYSLLVQHFLSACP